jgi:hypothetical protein
MAQGRAITKHRVKLTTDDRHTLEQLVRQGRAAGWKLRRAQALLKCDEGKDGPGWPDASIAEAFEVTTRSLENWRKQAVERGPMSLLERKSPDRSIQRKLDGVGEAKLVQLACSKPPEGYGRWSLRLLADQLVALEVVDSIGHECVRQTLKKTRSSRGDKRCGASRRSRTRRS